MCARNSYQSCTHAITIQAVYCMYTCAYTVNVGMQIYFPVCRGLSRASLVLVATIFLSMECDYCLEHIILNPANSGLVL